MTDTPTPTVDPDPEGFPYKPTPERRPPGRPRKDGTPPGSPREPEPTPDDTEPNRVGGPPRKRTRKPTPRTNGPTTAELANKVAQLHTIIGMGIAVAAGPRLGAPPATAVALMEQSTAIGTAWADLAASNPRVRTALIAITNGGSYGAILMAYWPIVAALQTDRQRLNPPPPPLTIVTNPPDDPHYNPTRDS